MELHRGGRWELKVGNSEMASWKRRPMSWALKDEQHLADKKGTVAKKP